MAEAETHWARKHGHDHRWSRFGASVISAHLNCLQQNSDWKMLGQRTPCCPISIQTPSFGACPCCKSQYLGSIGEILLGSETTWHSCYSLNTDSVHWHCGTWQPSTNIDPDGDQTAVRNTSAPCSWVSWFAWPDGTRLFMFMPSIHLSWSCQSLSISRCSVLTHSHKPQTNLNVQLLPLAPSGSAYGSPKLCSLYLLGASWGPAIAQGAVWRLMLPMMLHVPWIWKWIIDEVIENDTMIYRWV